MSDLPFGFGLPDRDPERKGGEGGSPNPADPFGLGALFGAGPGAAGAPEELLAKMPLFAELPGPRARWGCAECGHREGLRRSLGEDHASTVEG